MTKYYVDFLYPGAFVSESETRAIDTPLDVGTVPRGAYGYTVWERTERTVDGETLRGERRDVRSVVFGHVRTVPEMRARNHDGKYNILLSNMTGNGWPKVVETVRGTFLPLTANLEVREAP